MHMTEVSRRFAFENVKAGDRGRFKEERLAKMILCLGPDSMNRCVSFLKTCQAIQIKACRSKERKVELRIS